MAHSSGTVLMTEGDYKKKIIFFAIPVFIGALFQQMYNTVDSLIVGNYLGPDALAAVSSTGSLTFLLVGFFWGFSNGAGVIVARFIGARNEDRTFHAVHTAMGVGLVCGAVMTILGVIISPILLRIMQTPQSVYVEAKTYLTIYFAGSFFLVMYNMSVAILQAAGDSRHPLYYLVISSLTNIVLDVVFIAVFGMGVEGAALATIISECLSMLLCLQRLMRADDAFRVDLRKIHFDRRCVQQIIRQGLPTAFQSTVIDIGNLLIQSYINSFGSLAMAGIGAYTKVEGFCFLPVTSFSTAVTTFVSQNYGAGRRDRVRKGSFFSIACVVLMIEAIGVVMFLLAPQLVGAFSSDPSVIAYGVGRARVCCLFYCVLGFSHISSAVLRGIDKPVVPTVIMMVCWCAVRVASVMTIGQIWHHIELSYWLYPVTWALSTVLFIVILTKELRKKT